MTPLRRLLSARLAVAFAAEGLPEDLATVERSDRPDLAQFQCNGAMAAAKIAKAPPRQIAERIAARLADDGFFADVSVAGPGFINLNLSVYAVNAHLSALAAHERFGFDAARRQNVVLDFGGPNIAKPMHVGHLRATIIGDALQRIFRFSGDHTVSDVHMGDWGKPIGMLIDALRSEAPDLPYFAADAEGPFPAEPPVTMEALERLYPHAAAACKTDPDRDEAARRATAELQAGRPGYRALWQHFRDVSRQGMEREFGALGVTFDLWNGESDVDARIAPMLDDLMARGIAEQDDGAIIVRVARSDDTQDVPPLILRTGDGAATYGATDLATIAERVETFAPALILYVVDQRQHLHFEQVFRAAHLAGYAPETALEHLGFGTMNGPDGKPFKTRAGGVMKLYDLIALMRDKATERLDAANLAADMSAEERADIAQQVGMAALKFADLMNQRQSDYVFDIDRFVQFEGKTGPYLQYQAVRIQSILRKAGHDPSAPPPAAFAIESQVEMDLALTLSEFPHVIERTKEKRAPNILCEHAFELAQCFSRFYNAHHILSEDDAPLRQSRLGLCAVTLAQLTCALDLLGIRVPARM